ncbi:MAG: carboxypeptidase regulatory-like domain-containing protein, partial [Myxococcota bacterium]
MGLSSAGCTDPAPAARAYRVTSRAQLIGGPNALGEVGDFLLENDKIRVIIQDEGFSRGFGVFGGSLIDADLVRPGTGPGTSNEGGGRDNFGELFPSFFLEALAPSEVFDPDDPAGQRKLAAIEVTGDGRDGATAEVTVRGYGGDFLSLTQTINEFLLDDPREAPNLLFTTKYRLAPGRRYVEIVTTVHNVAFPERDLTLPNDLLGITVPSPFGDVLLFGAGNKVFLPHEAGFDTRFRLEAVYQAQNITLPALPGLAAEFIASAGPDVSYGLLAASPSDPELNFAYHNREFFPDATPHSLHVPFLASAFTGVFQVLPPPVLAANDGAAGGADEYSFTRYFIVGSGDVASVSDVVHDLLGTETGSIEGQVRDADGGQGVKGVSLVVTDPTGKKVTQLYSDDGGRFRARLPAGDYAVVLLKEGREATAPAGFSVKTGERTFVPLTLPGAARLLVTVIEPGVGPVPAKVSLVGTAPEETIGTDPRAWLFDLSLGERYRYTDFEPDTDEPSTRRYLEDFTYTEEGVATLKARPGTYTVVVTRGPEYERVEIPDVEISPGSTRTLSASIRRVVDTEGYIAADFHLHSIYSLDSFANLEDRVTSYAGEGLELVVATDHNYVVDYGPTIGKLGLERFVHSLVGLELTTIDRGHFNGFPLRRGNGALAGDGTGRYENTIASRTFGSFQWAERTPQQIFDSLRALAPKDPACLSANRNDPSICPDEVDRVIVQVNHPRDSILGYFDQYVLDQESLEVKGQSGLIGANTEQRPEYAASEFSWDFDALEVFNGKRFELLHNYVVPTGLPEDPVLGRPLDPVSCCPLTPGEVVREYPAFDCDDTLRDCTCTTADAEAQLAAGRCEGGEILHPGVVEDWFQLLRAGRRVVGTANSDSHEPDAEEPGYPRSYVRVSDDNPRQVTGQDIVAGFLAGDV